MSDRLEHKRMNWRAACLAALLAVPLAACSDRQAAPEGPQQNAQQMARDKEAERRSGSEAPELKASESDSTEGYSKPRESWTGGTARDAEFQGSGETDERVERRLAEELDGLAGIHLVEVEVEDGVALLRGEVESAVQRRQAETMALAMEEIVAVRNELEISAGSK